MRDQEMGSIGAMADIAEELDEIVAEVMRCRQLSGWRLDAATFEAVEKLAEASGRSFYEVLTDAVRAYVAREA